MAWSKLSRHARGYGAAWDKLRKQILERDKYLCQACLASNRPTSAKHVDHKIPKSKGGTDDPDNLQSLCVPCHDAKTLADKGNKVKAAFGADGWPIA